MVKEQNTTKKKCFFIAAIVLFILGAISFFINILSIALPYINNAQMSSYQETYSSLTLDEDQHNTNQIHVFNYLLEIMKNLFNSVNILDINKSVSPEFNTTRNAFNELSPINSTDQIELVAEFFKDTFRNITENLLISNISDSTRVQFKSLASYAKIVLNSPDLHQQSSTGFKELLDTLIYRIGFFITPPLCILSGVFSIILSKKYDYAAVSTGNNP